MKKIKYILLSCVIAFGMTSCGDHNNWLDVNEDPDNATATSATPEVRLPWIQNYFTYAWGCASMRTSLIYGVLTQTSKTSNNGLIAAWNPAQGSSTTPYQNFYIGAGVNINPLISKATSVGAYHYAGAACVIKSMGFNMMLDLFGEIPMNEAFTGKYNPSYDDGKALWFQSMDALEEGIKYLKMGNQNVAFADGDCWLNGDAAKWLKFAYGLKARYIAKLSKKFGTPITKKDGSTVTYNEDSVLVALSNSLQSNDDNVSVKSYNIQGDQTNFTVGDPVQANMLWNSLAYGSTQRLTKYYIDLFDPADPRIDKLVPFVMTDVVLNADGSLASFKWTRDQGVDMMGPNANRYVSGNIVNAAYVTGNPVTQTYSIPDATTRNDFVAAISKAHATTVDGNNVKVTYAKGQIYCSSNDYRHAGDTIYANMASRGYETSGRGDFDTYYYYSTNTAYPYVSGTGTFYGRILSDLDIMTYAELCFLKAEMSLRKGDAAAALLAYKAGVKANFDRMQAKLTEWSTENTTATPSVGQNPTMQPMDDAAVTTYLATVNAKTAVDIAEIMREKVIAVSFNYELWNDIRRYDYNNGKVNGVSAFPNYKRPTEFTATNKIVGATTTDQTDFTNPRAGYRRWMHSSHESNYNMAQMVASNPHAYEDEIYSIPVWWDCATDDEYYGYGSAKTY